MTGHNVLHPMGWDAFGLPAEQYAIETGTHPRDTTTTNVARFREQLQSLGFSYDWDREVATCDPAYFKWTQWIFLQLLEKGLAYRAEVPVNWCPALGTVLANEEVIDGLSERGNHPVIRKPMKQWMLKITAYGDRLLEDLDDLDWPESIKEMQRNWIGRSEGVQLAFEVPGVTGLDGDDGGDGAAGKLEVYTTRPDTLFGATYLVVRRVARGARGQQAAICSRSFPRLAQNSRSTHPPNAPPKFTPKRTPNSSQTHPARSRRTHRQRISSRLLLDVSSSTVRRHVPAASLHASSLPPLPRPLPKRRATLLSSLPHGGPRAPPGWRAHLGGSARGGDGVRGSRVA